MLDRINALKAEIEALQASDTNEVEALRLKYLSKKGAVNALMADLPKCPRRPKEKRRRGHQRT